MSRPLMETVSDLARAITSLAPDGLRVTRLEASVPLDLRLGGPAGGPVDVIADIPSWRWRTSFDREPGHLAIVFVTTVHEAGGES